MSVLRDFLVAPRTGEGVDGHAAREEAFDDRGPRAGASGVDDANPPREVGVDRSTRRSRRARAPASSVAPPAIGVLAPARDLPVAAAGVGLAVGRSAPAVLVCLSTPAFAPALRAPARAAAARLAASLRARGLEASARGRLAVVHLPDAGRTHAAARAMAAADGLPTVLAVAGRDEEVDALLAARDAILVALPASADPALAHLALAGAAALAPTAAAVTLALDPVQRALALAGARAPRALLAAVAELLVERQGAAAV
jgi:hypothetical protein